MWNPSRNKRIEALSLIKYHAKQGIIKELRKLNKRIKTKSDNLLKSEFSLSMKRRSAMRTELSLLCEERDRFELALNIIEEGDIK